MAPAATAGQIPSRITVIGALAEELPAWYARPMNFAAVLAAAGSITVSLEAPWKSAAPSTT